MAQKQLNSTKEQGQQDLQLIASASKSPAGAGGHGGAHGPVGGNLDIRA